MSASVSAATIRTSSKSEVDSPMSHISYRSGKFSKGKYVTCIPWFIFLLQVLCIVSSTAGNIHVDLVLCHVSILSTSKTHIQHVRSQTFSAVKTVDMATK